MTQFLVAARIDERGKASGGASGDQSGKELMVQNLPSSGSWSYILRPPKNASIMVQQAYNAAANDNIGYDQSQRTTLYTAAKAVNWNLTKVGKCECDCSSLIAVLCNCAGFPVSKDMYTGNERAVLKAQGFTQIAYSASVLVPGDVLWRSGHTGIYVGTSSYYTQQSASPSSSSGSSAIKAVQRWLNGFVSVNLVVDGIYGPKTKKALVKAWQRVVGTVQDGIWGPKTKAATPVLKKGSKGNAVRVLQGILICLGYDTGGFDGDFGSKTDTAVRAFQRANGLTVDGQAGKNTFAKLLG